MNADIRTDAAADRQGDSQVPVLELKGLSKSFGGLHAVRGVTFKIMPGDRKAIIGPNGAGMILKVTPRTA